MANPITQLGEVLGAPSDPRPKIKDLKKKLANPELFTPDERALVFPEEAAAQKAKATAIEVEKARKAALRKQGLRKGRRATILTSAQGVSEKLGSVNRPQARAATLLGG